MTFHKDLLNKWMNERNTEEESSSRTFGEIEKVARIRWSFCWVLK